MSPKRQSRVIKRGDWRRAKRPQRHKKVPPLPQVDIPEHTTTAPSVLFEAPEHLSTRAELLILAQHQAITEGLIMSIGSSSCALLDEFSLHVRGLTVYNIGMADPATSGGNIVALPGPVADAITPLLTRRYEHVAFLYLAGHAKAALPMLTGRIVAGSIVVLDAETVEDFCAWAVENKRELHPLLSQGRTAVVVMVAN